jgi:hypothetical protein
VEVAAAGGSTSRVDREACEAAGRLGGYSPEMFSDLAIVDGHFGDRAAH